MHATTPMTSQSSRFIFAPDDRPLSSVGEIINRYYLANEDEVMREMVELARVDDATKAKIRQTAERLVEAVRRNRGEKGGLDAFMKKYDLSSQEGVVLMCLAEALLRVPDSETADKLIADKLLAGNWKDHVGTSGSVFVNASTWGLMLTGRIIRLDQETVEHPGQFMRRMVARAGEPVIRGAMRQAMKIMGHQFVMGRTIAEAMKRSQSAENRQYRYTFDMLGEAALTREDSRRYFEAYCDGIDAIGRAAAEASSIDAAPSISVKLSALHPRYSHAQRERVLDDLIPLLTELALRAKKANIGFTVDSEEADRLELSLELFESVYRNPQLEGWEGLGLAIQAYQKRGLAVSRWVIDLAGQVGRRIGIRLVKGAYWDAEIKRAQVDGLEGYPVFTRKPNSDVCYLACARVLLEAEDRVYCQFATHNAQTLASVIHLAGSNSGYEFQRLHGMGDELYDEVVGADKLNLPCRVYAPVGNHEDLLPYLVRRLLENGSNTSFVNRIVDEKAPIDAIVEDPVDTVSKFDSFAHPRIPLPRDLYGTERKNSRGLNLADSTRLGPLAREMEHSLREPRAAAALVGGEAIPGRSVDSTDPADVRRVVGTVAFASADVARQAVDVAARAYEAWNRRPAAERAEMLDRTADLFETHEAELMALCVREAGKSIPDSIAELREAVDFLRYYAARARQDFVPRPMPGPTGERNTLELDGRGVFFCVSPWNFPLAIFTGQVSAALVAGNSVIAKPAEQTSLVAFRAVQLMHEAGIPGEVLNFLPGDGPEVAGPILPDPRVAGVAFTGSTETAQIINRALAGRDGPIAALIAETGGQNAMLVDSSALPEQVVLDAVQSAFYSAGQRCSALRALFLQDDIADDTIRLLKGYMDQLVVGDPGLLGTDVGPVIDEEALGVLKAHEERIIREGRLIHRCQLGAGTENGTFFAPLAVEIDGLAQLPTEVFGPVLHVVRYRARDLDAVIDQINNTGYGLTLGIHSRIDSQAQDIAHRIRVGNVYINRNQVGAVVGVQPFGGRGLSGTGPKAGGPDYLHRFATERTVTVNTAAVGGNTSLLSLDAD
ncbi:MAG: bifunctional proline dehydrogenase/L-glutamate gamma-semialdehyde dehydrogenase PutA [Gammaproteobacteria bacterium]|nr:MAG: integrase [Gammaproteobacteria bacterium SG8_31]